MNRKMKILRKLKQQLSQLLISTLKEELKIVSEMTTRSPEEHRLLVDEHSKLIPMLFARVVENAKEIIQLKADVESLDTSLKDVKNFVHSNLNDRMNCSTRKRRDKA